MNKIRFGKIGKKYAGRIAIGILCMILAIILDMIYPQITRKIVDDVILGGNTDILGGLLVAILLAGIGRGIFGYYKEYTFDIVGCSVGSEVRKGLFDRIQKLSLDYFDKTNTGELMARVKDDADMIWDAFGMTGMLTVEVVIHISMVLFCMFRMNVWLTLIPLTIMIILGFLAVYMEKELDKVFSDISEKNAELTIVAEENLSGVRTVKAFAREAYEIDKFKKKNKEYYELNMKQVKVLVRLYPFFMFIGKVLPVMMAIVGGVFVAKQQMSLGSLVAFVEYSRNIVWPMEVIGELANEISAIAASYKKINKVLANEPTVVAPEHPVHLDEVRGAVEFDHVSFERDGHEILKDISFTVPAGKTLGIMGETGSGKSSVINLMGRLFDATQGTVRFDGVDVKQLDLKQLRESIAPVMQDVFLFSDSVKDNIKMGARDRIEDREVCHAAKMAQADSFISGMEEKYDTIIGERGVGLSGGQKQRISIARSLAHRCPVLIMDDATSALDMETEREIQKELRNLKDSTKIIVAHRISAVRHADEIIVLKDGQIQERGTHEELLKQKGLYYETYESQYGEYKEVV